VRRLSGVSDVHELVRFEDPLAPAAAARLARREAVDLDTAADYVARLAQTRRLVLVEGAGGLLVRYDDDGATIADLARRVAAAVLVVADPRLGTLNATALTLEALAARGLALAGVVLGSWPREPDLACRANIRDLETLAARPLAGALPEAAAALAAPDFLLAARAGLEPALGGTFDAADFRRTYEPLHHDRQRGADTT
jgi:dethiobiotin synthetase